MVAFPDTPRAGTELETLRGILGENRSIMLWKLDGLDDDHARWSPVPSGTSLGGLVKHLAYVEIWWFRHAFASEDIDWDTTYPWSDDDPDADFRVEPGESVAALRALYASAVAHSDRVIDGATSLDARCALEGHDHRSLRWVVTHMIEETARHAGHADIIRELLDGSTGYLPE